MDEEGRELVEVIEEGSRGTAGDMDPGDQAASAGRVTAEESKEGYCAS